MGEMNAYKMLVRRSLGKSPLGRLMKGWEHNMKLHVREIGF
jgi:hypothetical protein